MGNFAGKFKFRQTCPAAPCWISTAYTAENKTYNLCSFFLTQKGMYIWNVSNNALEIKAPASEGFFSCFPQARGVLKLFFDGMCSPTHETLNYFLGFFSLKKWLISCLFFFFFKTFANWNPFLRVFCLIFYKILQFYLQFWWYGTLF